MVNRPPQRQCPSMTSSSGLIRLSGVSILRSAGAAVSVVQWREPRAQRHRLCDSPKHLAPGCTRLTPAGSRSAKRMFASLRKHQLDGVCGVLSIHDWVRAPTRVVGRVRYRTAASAVANQLTCSVTALPLRPDQCAPRRELSHPGQPHVERASSQHWIALANSGSSLMACAPRRSSFRPFLIDLVEGLG